MTYGLFGRTDFDGNKDSCLRVKHAYAPVMYNYNWWVPDNRPQRFWFQSCSGTRWRQIDHDNYMGHVQLDDIQQDTDMILLQAGGNNAGFADVAYNCIFTPQGQDYGPAYPDPRGGCYQALERASNYIESEEQDGLFQDARWIVNKVFEHPKTRANPQFRLFVVGYFTFFHDEGGDGDWCDDVSFALRYSDRPTLTLALRKRINELIQDLNAQIKKGVEGSFYPERAKFLDMDSHIKDGRFCQPGHSIWDQYWGGKVLLWNMSPEGVVFGNGGNGGTDGQNGTYEVREPTPAEFEKWRETGRFTDDPREISPNMSTLANAALEQANGVATAGDSDPKWLDFIGPYQRNWPGMGLRPFHPKEIGYASMAGEIMNSVLAEYRNNPVKNEHSVQLVFCKFKNRYSWYGFAGPAGYSVNPCFARITDHGFKAVIWDLKEYQSDLDIENPPKVKEGTTWKVNIPGKSNCRFEADGNGPGALKCGDTFMPGFRKDDSFDDGIIKCQGQWSGDEYWFHRAWVVEW